MSTDSHDTQLSESMLAVAGVGTALLAVLPAPSGFDVYATRFAGLLLAAALWLIAGTTGSLRRPGRTDWRFLASLAVLAAVVILATLTGYAPPEMLTFGNGYYGGALTWIVWLLVAGLASLAKPTRGLRRGLLWSQLPIAVCSVAALVDRMRGSSYLGGFENSNHLVPGLIIGVAVSVGLWRSSKDARRKAMSLGTALVAAAAVVASGSASGIVGLVVVSALAVIVTPGLLRVPVRGQSAVRRAGVGVTVLLVACVVAIATFAGVAASAGMGTLREELVGDSLTSRLFFWDAAWTAALDRPVLGLGADGFEVAAQQRLDGSEGAQVALGVVHDWAPVAGDPHNIVFTILVSFGILGLLAASGVLAVWIARLIELRKTGHWSDLRSAFVIGVAGWFTAMLFLPLSVQWGGYVAMVFGLAMASDREAEDAAVGVGGMASRQRRDPKTGAARIGALVLAAALVTTAGCVLLGNYWLQRAASSEDAPSALRYLDRAQAVQPAMVYYEVTELDVLGQALDGSPEALGRYQRSVDRSSAAVRTDARYMVMLIRAALDEAYMTGRQDLSWEAARLAELTASAPMLPEVAIERAHLALLQRDQALAQELLIEVKPYESVLPRTALYRLYYARLVGNQQAESDLRAVVARQRVPERLFSR